MALLAGTVKHSTVKTMLLFVNPETLCKIPFVKIITFYSQIIKTCGFCYKLSGVPKDVPLFIWMQAENYGEPLARTSCYITIIIPYRIAILCYIMLLLTNCEVRIFPVWTELIGQ